MFQVKDCKLLRRADLSNLSDPTTKSNWSGWETVLEARSYEPRGSAIEEYDDDIDCRSCSQSLDLDLLSDRECVDLHWDSYNKLHFLEKMDIWLCIWSTCCLLLWTFLWFTISICIFLSNYQVIACRYLLMINFNRCIPYFDDFQDYIYILFV